MLTCTRSCWTENVARQLHRHTLTYSNALAYTNMHTSLSTLRYHEYQHTFRSASIMQTYTPIQAHLTYTQKYNRHTHYHSGLSLLSGDGRIANCTVRHLSVERLFSSLVYVCYFIDKIASNFADIQRSVRLFTVDL